MDVPHYIDWNTRKWRPVTVTVEKHVNIVLLGYSKTKPLVGMCRGTDGQPVVFHTSRIDGKPLHGHFCEYLDNVPESEAQQRINTVKDRLCSIHGVTPDEIEVHYQ